MTDRIAEKGAVQYAQDNPTSSGVSRLGAAGAIQAAISDAISSGVASLTTSRLGGKGRIYALAASAGPLFLFQNGEQGFWFDPSDFSTLFQDSAGTTPVTAVGDPVGKILDKSGRGNHATQGTSTARPTLQQDSGGRYYLSFDGVDDFLITGSINFTATNKVTVFTGLRKLSDAATAMICELSTSIATNAGSFYLTAPETTTRRYGTGSNGTGGAAIGYVSSASFLSPVTNVITAQHNLAGGTSEEVRSARFNGVATTLTYPTAILGGGNFGNYPLYVGMRAGTTLPFNGRIYSLIVRGATSSAAEISTTESYVNSKTGAY